VSVIVIQFITLDGIVSDPDGSGGTPTGGWAFRHGPETVAGDKFRLGGTLDEGVMLLGVGPGSCSRGSGRSAMTRSPRG
jgi:hypothetical protein